MVEDFIYFRGHCGGQQCGGRHCKGHFLPLQQLLRQALPLCGRGSHGGCQCSREDREPPPGNASVGHSQEGRSRQASCCRTGQATRGDRTPRKAECDARCSTSQVPGAGAQRRQEVAQEQEAREAQVAQEKQEQEPTGRAEVEGILLSSSPRAWVSTPPRSFGLQAGASLSAEVEDSTEGCQSTCQCFDIATPRTSVPAWPGLDSQPIAATTGLGAGERWCDQTSSVASTPTQAASKQPPPVPDYELPPVPDSVTDREVCKAHCKASESLSRSPSSPSSGGVEGGQGQGEVSIAGQSPPAEACKAQCKTPESLSSSPSSKRVEGGQRKFSLDFPRLGKATLRGGEVLSPISKPIGCTSGPWQASCQADACSKEASQQPSEEDEAATPMKSRRRQRRGRRGSRHDSECNDANTCNGAHVGGNKQGVVPAITPDSHNNGLLKNNLPTGRPPDTIRVHDLDENGNCLAPAGSTDVIAIGANYTVDELLSSKDPTSFKTPEEFATFAGSLMQLMNTGGLGQRQCASPPRVRPSH